MSAKQRVALVTGAASGIGWALVQALLARGFSVVMADIAEQRLHEKMQSEQLKNANASDLLALPADVRQFESMQSVAEKTMATFGRIDWLFNNAGISGPLAPIWEVQDEDIQNLMGVNLYGMINGIKAFLPFMEKQSHRSHIINMASIYGLCSGSQLGAYAMSKHAVVALSESLYFDLQRLSKPIDVSLVCPSFVNTELLADAKAYHSPNPKFQQMLHELIQRSRPAADVAEYIIQAVEEKKFYILPDKEVKDYCEQGLRAIIDETDPYLYSIEKIIRRLSERAST